MANTVLNALITIIVSTGFGYCISLIKNYKQRLKEKEKNETIQNEALLIMIQNDLTNIFLKYEKKKAIPDYVFRNWNNLFKIYIGLGGNDYCHTLKKIMENWDIVKTDIL